jgi:hypothetical protein
MSPGPNQQIHFFMVPQTWYGRLLAAAAGVLLLLLLIFFFTLFLIIFGLLAVVVAIYMVLSGRQPDETPSGNAIRVEYFPAHPDDEPIPLDQQQENPDNS